MNLGWGYTDHFRNDVTNLPEDIVSTHIMSSRQNKMDEVFNCLERVHFFISVYLRSSAVLNLSVETLRKNLVKPIDRCGLVCPELELRRGLSDEHLCTADRDIARFFRFVEQLGSGRVVDCVESDFAAVITFADAAFAEIHR